MELMTCKRIEFKKAILLISDIKELKTILQELTEREIIEKEKIDEVNKKGELVDVQEKLETFNRIQIRNDLKYKAKMCREYILMLELNEKVFCDKAKKTAKRLNSGSEEKLRQFSWGIAQREEPKEIFNAIWRYAKNNKNVKHELQVAEYGKFLWSDMANMTLEQLSKNSNQSDITVQSYVDNEGRETIYSQDILLALEEDKKRRGELSLVRVRIKDKEEIGNNSELDYMMLISLEQGLDWKKPELQEFFAQTYLSTTFVGITKKMRKEEKCIYGGKLIQKQNGTFEVNFDSDMDIEAVAIANNMQGTTQGVNGNIKDDLGNVVIGIHDVVSGKELRPKKVRRMFEEIEAFEKGE